MANVFKRGGRWYYRFFHNGKRYRGSAGPEATKELADALLKKKIREVTSAEINGPQIAPITFDAFAEDFLRTDSPQKKSKDRDRMIIATFKDQWPGVRLDSITTKMIADFKAERLKYRAAATVHKELQVLKRLFKMAVEWGRLRVNPAITVQKPTVRNNRVRHLTPEEIVKLEAALPDWLVPYVRFARFTGARRGEIFGLTWNDVDLKRGMITFRATKNGEDGTVEMNATTKALLESLPAPMSRAQRVFPAVKIEKVRKAWQASCRKAKTGKQCACVGQPRDPKSRKKCPACRDSGIIPDFNFHDLRHQAATDLLTRGEDLNDVRDFLRHKSMTMTLRYAHLVDARRKRTAHLLDQPAPTAQNWPQSGV